MENKFICNICGNSDFRYIGYKNGKPYCRRCMTFQGKNVNYVPRIKGDVEYDIDFSLTEEQKIISKKIKQNYIDGKNTLLNAVCGAGKTEIVYEVMAYVLSNGGKVGFAIPRKDVVIELEPRIKKAFAKMHVVSVYGGHTHEVDGDIIILTTHQLYRYISFFDLLIVDEIDAFPFQNNELLHTFFKKSIRTNYIFMSATPSGEIIETFVKSKNKIEFLNKRFHGYSIPRPIILKKNIICQIAFILKRIKEYYKQNKPILIFVPTISIGNWLFKILKIWVKSLDYVNSKVPNKDEIINKFKRKELHSLISTSILERGITIENLQVIVFQSDHQIFNSQNLTQIAGRVGRKSKYPKGDIYFLAKIITKEMETTIKNIDAANKYL